MNRIRALTVGAACALFAFSAAAGDIDLTGTWKASYTCEGTSEGEPLAESFDFEARVVQKGARIRVDYNDRGVASVYQGVVQPMQPGENFLTGIVQACGGGYRFEELIRIKNAYTFEEEDGFTGSMAGDSIFVTRDFPGFEGDLEIDTCVYAFNRVSTEKPEVAKCAIVTRLNRIVRSRRSH